MGATSSSPKPLVCKTGPVYLSHAYSWQEISGYHNSSKQIKFLLESNGLSVLAKKPHSILTLSALYGQLQTSSCVVAIVGQSYLDELEKGSLEDLQGLEPNSWCFSELRWAIQLKKPIVCVLWPGTREIDESLVEQLSESIRPAFYDCMPVHWVLEGEGLLQSAKRLVELLGGTYQGVVPAAEQLSRAGLQHLSGIAVDRLSLFTTQDLLEVDDEDFAQAGASLTDFERHGLARLRAWSKGCDWDQPLPETMLRVSTGGTAEEAMEPGGCQRDLMLGNWAGDGGALLKSAASMPRVLGQPTGTRTPELRGSAAAGPRRFASGRASAQHSSGSARPSAAAGPEDSIRPRSAGSTSPFWQRVVGRLRRRQGHSRSGDDTTSNGSSMNSSEASVVLDVDELERRLSLHAEHTRCRYEDRDIGFEHDIESSGDEGCASPSLRRSRNSSGAMTPESGPDGGLRAQIGKAVSPVKPSPKRGSRGEDSASLLFRTVMHRLSNSADELPVYRRTSDGAAPDAGPRAWQRTDFSLGSPSRPQHPPVPAASGPAAFPGGAARKPPPCSPSRPPTHSPQTPQQISPAAPRHMSPAAAKISPGLCMPSSDGGHQQLPASASKGLQREIRHERLQGLPDLSGISNPQAFAALNAYYADDVLSSEPSSEGTLLFGCGRSPECPQDTGVWRDSPGGLCEDIKPYEPRCGTRGAASSLMEEASHGGQDPSAIDGAALATWPRAQSGGVGRVGEEQVPHPAAPQHDWPRSRSSPSGPTGTNPVSPLSQACLPDVWRGGTPDFRRALTESLLLSAPEGKQTAQRNSLQIQPSVVDLPFASNLFPPPRCGKRMGEGGGMCFFGHRNCTNF